MLFLLCFRSRTPSFPYFFAQNAPRVNIIEFICGVKRFVTTVECTGKVKNRSFLADLMETYISEDVAFVVGDGACGGMLKILEERTNTVC